MYELFGLERGDGSRTVFLPSSRLQLPSDLSLPTGQEGLYKQPDSHFNFF